MLQSEIETLDYPCATVLAFNVLALLKRCVQQAHSKQAPQLDVSTYHLGVHMASNYQGMRIALPSEVW